MRKSCSAVAALAMVCFTSIIEARVFYGNAGMGYVVDAETGHGVEDVMIEASWVITNSGDPSAAPLAELFHAYTMTDRNGRFAIRAWGPVEVDLHSSVRSVLKVIDHSQPHLYLYKPGYRLSEEKGPSEDPRSFWAGFHFSAEETREAWWDHRVFELAAYGATGEVGQREVAETFAALADCKWVRLPRIAAAYIRETRRAGKGSSAAIEGTPSPLTEFCPQAPHQLSWYLE